MVWCIGDSCSTLTARILDWSSGTAFKGPCPNLTHAAKRPCFVRISATMLCQDLKGPLLTLLIKLRAVLSKDTKDSHCQRALWQLKSAITCCALQTQINTAAVSTVDYIALVCLMNDMRVKLVEDMISQHRPARHGIQQPMTTHVLAAQLPKCSGLKILPLAMQNAYCSLAVQNPYCSSLQNVMLQPDHQLCKAQAAFTPQKAIVVALLEQEIQEYATDGKRRSPSPDGFSWRNKTTDAAAMPRCCA
eukprot:912418-Pelagomonas_calceolata.AAC.1